MSFSAGQRARPKSAAEVGRQPASSTLTSTSCWRCWRSAAHQGRDAQRRRTRHRRDAGSRGRCPRRSQIDQVVDFWRLVAKLDARRGARWRRQVEEGVAHGGCLRRGTTSSCSGCDPHPSRMACRQMRLLNVDSAHPRGTAPPNATMCASVAVARTRGHHLPQLPLHAHELRSGSRRRPADLKRQRRGHLQV